MAIGDPVYDSIGGGQSRYYIFPFLSVGVTVRVEVFRGGVWCYASDTNRNPSSVDYIWRLYISEYNDSFIDPALLGRAAGTYLFIAIESIEASNDFKLNSTSGNTSIAGLMRFFHFMNTLLVSLTSFLGRYQYRNCIP